MRKIYTLIVLIVVFCTVNLNIVSASRAFSPNVIPDIFYRDLRISAENSTPENMGIVQAFNQNTDKPVWSKKVYDVIISKSIEEDVQEVFIKSMTIDKDKLVIVNERNERFELNPMTGKTYSGYVVKAVVLGAISLALLLIIAITVHKFIMRCSKLQRQS